MDCSDKIKHYRKMHNMSQSRLAGLLGVSNRAVSKWENGISLPTTENFVKLSHIFGCTTDELLSKEKEEKNIKKSPKGMESLGELYRVGRGPSSSHTMGPEAICEYFKNKNPNANRFKVILYGSLAKTGVGHGTDKIVKDVLGESTQIIFDYEKDNIPHPNTMELFAFCGENECDHIRAMSVGGGRIEIEGVYLECAKDVYPHTLFSEISDFCRQNNIELWQYAERFEGKEILEYLKNIWKFMKESIDNGLGAEGILPGGLDIQRKAKYLFSQKHIDESAQTKENRIVCSYAFAVSEENACGGRIVTAPTCGASGVLPAVLYYQQMKNGFSDDDIVKAISTGGLIGNLIKTNASISGAECGCQAEIGSACAMAAAALGQLLGLGFEEIEYAAEIAIEHHLGLTCDPVCGLVQIPCIERNAVAAMRAINAVTLASFLSDTRKISIDNVIKTMKETGLDISKRYKETSEAGLAKIRLK